MSLHVPSHFEFLYTCLGCGFVSTQNFRDSHCPVCKNSGDVARLRLADVTGGYLAEPAPHTDDDVDSRKKTLTELGIFTRLRQRIWQMIAGLELTKEEGDILIEEIRIRIRRPPQDVIESGATKEHP